MKKKSHDKGKKVRGLIIIGVEAVALIAVIIILIYTFRVTGKDTGIIKYNLPEDEIIVSTETTEENEHIVEVKEEEAEKYTTLALFGVDARGKKLEKGTRSDTIIVCSIDNETGETRLCSIYRDTLLNISSPDKNPSYQKCNGAYAYFGPAGAMNMLNQNLDLNITQFITMGFEGVIHAVDAVEGVEIDVHADEIKYLNDYQASMYSTESQAVITDDFIRVTDSGLQTLSGYQALAYCRIRYTAGNDFRRTERQREVINQIVAKAKKMNPSQATKICNEVFPLVATNLDLDEDIIPMATEVGKYEIVDSTGFPFDDKFTTGLLGSKGDCVIPLDLESNVVELHKFLYPKVIDYTPSENVVKTSKDIKEEAAKYGK